MVPVTAIDHLLESLAGSFNGSYAAIHDEIQLEQKIDIDRRRHCNEETVLVAKMSMTEWQ